MEYIKKLANDETWDCATFSGMCRFVANGNYYELPKPIEELAEKSNFSVFDAPADNPEAPVLGEKSVFVERDDFLNVIEDALGLESDSISSSGWSFGIDDNTYDRLLTTEEQELIGTSN